MYLSDGGKQRLLRSSWRSIPEEKKNREKEGGKSSEKDIEKSRFRSRSRDFCQFLEGQIKMSHQMFKKNPGISFFSNLSEQMFLGGIVCSALSELWKFPLKLQALSSDMLEV